jgi:capsular polysaccharide biosynthesis protein
MACRPIEEHALDRFETVSCIRLRPAEQTLCPMPAFMFGPVPDHLPRTLFGSLQANALGCYVIRTARIARDGLVAQGAVALCSDALNMQPDYVAPKLDALATLPVRRVPGQAVCLFGPGYPVWGHWLVDFLPRLHLLRLAGFRIERLRFLLPQDSPEFAVNLLRQVGVDPESLVFYDADSCQVQVDELILPTTLRKGSRLHSAFAEATRAWTKFLIPAGLSGVGKRRLFISRTRFGSTRHLTNRARIEAMAAAAGFEIIHPEAMPLRVQIALFASARQVMGEYGSGLHNTIFGSPELHCCALRGTSHWGGLIQSYISASFGQSMSYFFGESDTVTGSVYSWTLYEEDFGRVLECLEIERK